jgi:hypothetical protein
VQKEPRTEREIFEDLVNLCTRPGYVHAIAYLCFRDNVIGYTKDVSGKDFAKMRSFDRLIRNEINALIGCMVKADLDWSLPDPATMTELIESSDSLLAEYHDRMTADAYAGMSAEAVQSGFDPTSTGEALREAVFYAAESAYVFQFRDMACERYGKDSDWLVEQKGYSPIDAREICRALFASQNQIITTTLDGLRTKPPSEWTVLEGFRLDIDDIADRCGKTKETISRFLSAFTYQIENGHEGYLQIDDFNEVAVTPILQAPNGALYLLQYYPLVEAVYDSPFYWFSGDKKYFPTASRNRGEFTEKFLTERLISIFGKESVFANVDVYEGKNRVGEIDCLVVFGEYAIIFQAKSQHLTLPARKGKLEKLKDDFGRAVQKPYDQAVACARMIPKKGVRYVCPDRKEPDLSQIERAYPVCVLADHYPALAMQAKSFLKSTTDSLIGAPLVCDLFLIDVATEMLPSPLRFLSYITLRAQFGEKILVTNELATFGYYLRQSLWVDDTHDMLLLDDSVASDLDAAMTVRRDGLPGDDTPKGILTKLQNTRLGKIVAEVEHDPNQFSVGMGLSILEMGEDSIRKMSSALDLMIRDAGRTGRHHDLTIPLEHRDAGLSIHVNADPNQGAFEKLRSHMLYRKYAQRAGKWFGLLLEPTTGRPRFGAKVRSAHAFDFELEAITANAAPLQELDELPAQFSKRKIYRNDPCPCGSGKKFKRCCLG